MVYADYRIHNLFSLIRKVDAVRALVLVGSRTGGTPYQPSVHSDIDAYIITLDRQTQEMEQTLPDIVQSCGHVLFSYRHDIGFVAVMDDLQRIELPVVPVSRISEVFSRPVQQKVHVVFDRTGGILEKILLDRPSAIDFAHVFKKKVYDFWYWQIVGSQYLLKGELYNARSVANIQASSLIWFCELLDNPDLLLLEERKRVEQSLPKKFLTLLSSITPAYETGQIHASLVASMDIFPDIFRKIHTKYGYPYDSSPETSVKQKLLSSLAVTKNNC